MADKYSITRKIALVSMLIFDILMLTMLFLSKLFIWFWVFVAINIAVIAGEITSVILRGKTISTWMKYAIEDGKHRVKIYLALLFMGLAIASLIVHLGVVQH